MVIRSFFRILIAILALMAIAVLVFMPIMTSSTDLNTILIDDNLSLMNLFNSLKEVFANDSQNFLSTVWNYSLVIMYILIPPFILFTIFISALKGVRRKRKRAKVIGKSFVLLYWIMIVYILRMTIDPRTFNVNFGPLIYFMTIFLKSDIDQTVIILLLGSMGLFIFFELFARALNSRIAYAASMKSIEKKKAEKTVNLTPNSDLAFSGNLNPSFNQQNIDTLINPSNTIIYNNHLKDEDSQSIDEPLAKQNTVPLQNRVIYQQESPKWSELPSFNQQKDTQSDTYPSDSTKDEKYSGYSNQKESGQQPSSYEQSGQAASYKEPYAKQPSYDQQSQTNYNQPRDINSNYGAYNSPSGNYNQPYNRPNQQYYGQQSNNPYYNQPYNRPNQQYYGQQSNNPYYNQPYNRPNQQYYGQNPYYYQNQNYPKTPYEQAQAQAASNYNNPAPSEPGMDVKPNPTVQTNTVNCPDCGTIVIKGQKFCSNCGKSMKQTCPQCSTEVTSNSKFCSNCGFRLN
ncbi:MAG: zinc-ribbon domain-containing protein [Bacilli bacterium]|jgi:hypothetical protein